MTDAGALIGAILIIAPLLLYLVYLHVRIERLEKKVRSVR